MTAPYKETTFVEAYENFTENNNKEFECIKLSSKVIDLYYGIYEKHQGLIIALETIDSINEREKYLKISKQKDRLSTILDKLFKTKELLNFETELLASNSEYLSRVIDYYKNLNNQTTTFPFLIKKMSKSKKRIIEKDTCAFCLDTHNHKRQVVTQCGHYFGKLCFEQYLTANTNKNVICPLCRNDCATCYLVR